MSATAPTPLVHEGHATSTRGRHLGSHFVTPSRVKGLAGFVALLVGGFVVCVFRPLHASQRFSLFGEDGPVFTAQVRSRGIAHSFFTTYAGYYHLLPRSVAAVASVFPLHRTVQIYAVSAWLIAALAAAIAWYSGRGMGLNALGAFVVAGTVLLLPAAGAEVIDNLTYIEWYCAAAAIVFVAAWIAGYRPPLWIVVPLLVVAGLTTPVLIAVLPFAIIAYVVRRWDRYDLGVVLALLVGVVIQLVGRSESTTGTSFAIRPRFLTDLFLVRAVGGAVTGQRFLHTVYVAVHPVGLAAIALVLFCILVVGGSLGLAGRKRLVFWFLILEALGLTLMAVVLRPDLYQTGAIGFWSRGTAGVQLVDDLIAGGRYFALPALCLITALMLWISDRRHRTWFRWGVSMPIMAAALLVLAANVRIDVARYPEALWLGEVASARATCAKADQNAVVTIYNAPGPPWAITLTCRQAFG